VAQGADIYEEFSSIAFNPDIDTLFFEVGHALKLIDNGHEDLADIRYMAVYKADVMPMDDDYVGAFMSSYFKNLLVLFDKCPSLERLYLIAFQDP
jgi:hypothetical protein